MYLVFNPGNKRRKAQIISALNAIKRSRQIGDGSILSTKIGVKLCLFSPGFYIRGVIKFIQSIFCWYSEEPYQIDGSFELSKQVLMSFIHFF